MRLFLPERAIFHYVMQGVKIMALANKTAGFLGGFAVLRPFPLSTRPSKPLLQVSKGGVGIPLGQSS